eukprot:9360-Pelagomonas_calceolata.AAC.1
MHSQGSARIGAQREQKEAGMTSSSVSGGSRRECSTQGPAGWGCTGLSSVCNCRDLCNRGTDLCNDDSS